MKKLVAYFSASGTTKTVAEGLKKLDRDEGCVKQTCYRKCKS